MSVEVQDRPQPSATALVSGIIDDVQNLVKQQFQLARTEIEQDLRKSKDGAVLYVIGGVVLLLATFMACLAVSHLLHWLTSPAGTDAAKLPLWACYAIVGAVLGGVGYLTTSAAAKLFSTIDPLNGPTVEAMKDNVDWKTDKN